MFDKSEYVCLASESAMPISLYSSYSADPMQISFAAVDLPPSGRCFSIRVGEGGLFRMVEDWRERIEKICLTIVQTFEVAVKTVTGTVASFPRLFYTLYKKKPAIFRAVRRLRL